MNEEVLSLLDEIGAEIVTQMQGKLISSRRRATGSLINSIQYEVLDSKLVITFKDYGPESVNPRSGVRSGNIDQGRRPNKRQPPTDPIYEWLKVKRIRWHSGGSSRDVLSKSVRKATSAAKKNKMMAFVIARSIGRKGFKGTDFTLPMKPIQQINKTKGDSFKNILLNIFKKK